jgi:hypothetical protein
MSLRAKRWRAGAITATLVVAACGDDDDASPVTDAGADVRDATVDARVDAGLDAADSSLGGDATDAGADAGVDAPFTGDAATCEAGAGPLSGQPKGTITASGSFTGVPLPTADVRAETLMGVSGNLYLSNLTIHMTDFANACGYVAGDVGKALANDFILLMSLQSTAGPPPAFTVGTYTIGADAGAYVVYAGLGRFDYGTTCVRSAITPAVPTGSMTLTSVTASRVTGSFSITFDGKPLDGTFDAPICTYPTFLNYPSCCVN